MQHPSRAGGKGKSEPHAIFSHAAFTARNVTYVFLATFQARNSTLISEGSSDMEVNQSVRVPVAPEQRRRVNGLYPGLTVRVISQSPYIPSHWICLSERTGCKIVVPTDDVGDLLAERV